MSGFLYDAPYKTEASRARSSGAESSQPPSPTLVQRAPGQGKTTLADLLADDAWRAEVTALDEELTRLSAPNNRLRLRFGYAISKLGMRFRDLGFRRLDLYVRERASRPGRWGADSRRMAERLQRFDLLREAFEAGQVSWSMAELIARYLEQAPDDEAEIVAQAAPRTVRAMREMLSQRTQKSIDETPTDPEGSTLQTAARYEEDDEGRVRLRRRLPAHQAMGLDMVLRVIQHQSGGTTGDAFEWLLAEAQTGLLPRVPSELQRIAEEIAARFHERAKDRAAALTECDPHDEAMAEEGTPEPPGGITSDGDDEPPLPEDSIALDAVIRELGYRISSAELYRGWTLTRFLALRGWAVLGYASDTHYARERLGMSRSDMYRQARLARRCERLPHLRDAVRSGVIGSTRVATRDWNPPARPRRRTGTGGHR